jgi:two-component system sensor histidine kinase DegS
VRERHGEEGAADLDRQFQEIVDGLRKYARRLRQQVDRFGRTYQRRAEAPVRRTQEAAASEEATRRAHRRLRQLQLAVGHVDSSVSYLSGFGIGIEERAPEAEVARRVLDSLEAERERLYRDVHDGPAQVLANAIFELEYLERITERAPAELRQTLRTEMANLRSQFRTSLDAVRAIIYDLRPPELSRLGLAAALRNYAGEYEARSGLRLVTRFDVGATGLEPQQELAAYRIMQEALQNVHRHASASTVRLSWGRDGDNWALRVSDDGVGFDLVKAARRPRSVGLLAMRERAELIGAALLIQSSPGQGTTVTLLVPVRDAHTEREGPVPITVRAER